MNPMLVHDYLQNSAAREPDKTALICGGQRLTYAQINDMSDRLARALVDMGVRRQDRVAVFLDNSVEAVVSIFGILKAGGIFLVLHSGMKSRKLNYILNNSGARAIISHRTQSRVLSE